MSDVCFKNLSIHLVCALYTATYRRAANRYKNEVHNCLFKNSDTGPSNLMICGTEPVLKF